MGHYLAQLFVYLFIGLLIRSGASYAAMRCDVRH